MVKTRSAIRPLEDSGQNCLGAPAISGSRAAHAEDLPSVVAALGIDRKTTMNRLLCCYTYKNRSFSISIIYESPYSDKHSTGTIRVRMAFPGDGQQVSSHLRPS